VSYTWKILLLFNVFHNKNCKSYIKNMTCMLKIKYKPYMGYILFPTLRIMQAVFLIARTPHMFTIHDAVVCTIVCGYRFPFIRSRVHLKCSGGHIWLKTSPRCDALIVNFCCLCACFQILVGKLPHWICCICMLSDA
jgi:hypothetical protein